MVNEARKLHPWGKGMEKKRRPSNHNYANLQSSAADTAIAAKHHNEHYEH